MCVCVCEGMSTTYSFERGCVTTVHPVEALRIGTQYGCESPVHRMNSDMLVCAVIKNPLKEEGGGA